MRVPIAGERDRHAGGMLGVAMIEKEAKGGVQVVVFGLERGVGGQFILAEEQWAQPFGRAQEVHGVGSPYLLQAVRSRQSLKRELPHGLEHPKTRRALSNSRSDQQALVDEPSETGGRAIGRDANDRRDVVDAAASDEHADLLEERALRGRQQFVAPRDRVA